MKIKATSLAFLAVAGASMLTSCSDWFDIDPKTDVKTELLFSTANGYHSALQGVYTKMAEGDTYGSNLTFGMLDQLTLMYDYVPTGATSKTDIFEYENTTSGGFNTKRQQANIWAKAYNHIANLNNLVKWLDKQGHDYLDAQTWNTLKGEAYGLRAFIHFDLLRLWGPMGYDVADATRYIPYRTVVDNSKQPLLAPAAVVDSLLRDVHMAQELLSAEKGTSLSDSERRFRMNYYAAKALEARICLYCGMKDEAILAAKEVVDGCGLVLSTDNSTDPAFFSETLFGVYMYRMDEELSGMFAEGPNFTTQLVTDVNTMRDYFENFTGTTSDVDIRIKSSGILGYNSTKFISRKYIKNDVEVVPLIRLPEMYYILCEASPLAQAAEYVNIVKSKRGYTRGSLNSVFSDEETRHNVLNYEYRTEFYAEGQYFHFMKRKGIESQNYAPDVTFDRAKYVFPLPDDEVEYGWSEGDEE